MARELHALTTRFVLDGPKKGKIATPEGHVASKCGKEVKLAPGALSAWGSAFHSRVTCPACLARCCPAPGLHPDRCCPPTALPPRPVLTIEEFRIATRLRIASRFAAIAELVAAKEAARAAAA